MESLYKLDQKYLDFMSMINDMEEVDEQLIADTMEGLEGDFRAKAEACECVATEFRSKAERLKAEIKRMETLAKSYEGKADTIEKNIENSMLLRNDTKFATDLFKFQIKGNGGAKPLVWTAGQPKSQEEIKALPERFITTEYKVNNAEIRKALDAEEKLDFAAYGERGSHLEIK